jgi:hypothetical protein
MPLADGFRRVAARLQHFGDRHFRRRHAELVEVVDRELVHARVQLAEGRRLAGPARAEDEEQHGARSYLRRARRGRRAGGAEPVAAGSVV